MSPSSWVRFGAVAGIVGATLFSAMWVIAAVKDGHWILGEQTLSELGGNRPGLFFFNSGVILEGTLALVFTFGLWHAMEKTTLQRIGNILLLFASCALILVGIFPITTGLLHGIASYAFFGLTLVAILLLIHPLWTDGDFGPVAGIVTLGAVILSIAFLSFATIALTEAVGVICLLAWSSLLSAMMLRKNTISIRT
ncbi:MAG: DUF998 domain-containing protein [Methanomassiliicoccales archaeon]|jgi:hypothetical membrane protein